MSNHFCLYIIIRIKGALMLELETKEIIIRLLLTIVFSGLIGFEREKNNSSAGLKTNILVGLGSAVVALTQFETMYFVSKLNPESNISVDSVRLIAQVVSGIGFLGAGAIIITKRSIIGLTTAATLWCVSVLGLAFGMGYYPIAISGAILTLSILVFFKRILVINGPQQFLIKYITSAETLKTIDNAVSKISNNYETLRISTTELGDNLITTHVYRLHTKHHIEFSELIHELSGIENVISVERTEIG